MLPNKLAWWNGAIVPLEKAAPSIASNSIHMATGVFDGLMAYWNDDHHYLHRAIAHFARFKASSEYMDLAFSWSVEELDDAAHEVLRTCAKCTHYIRPITLRAGPSVPAITWQNSTLPVDVCIIAVPVGRDEASPMSCQLSPVERVSGRAMPVARKACGVYVNSFLAQREAERAGFDTGLMLDISGRITEASTSNVFFIQSGRLVTPALSPEVFPGVTRSMVIEISEDLGIPVTERAVYPQELPEFDGAFLCATLIELRPISRVGSYTYDPSSAVFDAVLKRFRDVTHERHPSQRRSERASIQNA